MKKAQSISINTIVVAAIALVVMILIVMIFTGRMTIFRISSGSCDSANGRCIDVEQAKETCNDDFNKMKWEFKCFTGSQEDKTKVCCVST